MSPILFLGAIFRAAQTRPYARFFFFFSFVFFLPLYVYLGRRNSCWDSFAAVSNKMSFLRFLWGRLHRQTQTCTPPLGQEEKKNFNNEKEKKNLKENERQQKLTVGFARHFVPSQFWVKQQLFYDNSLFFSHPAPSFAIFFVGAIGQMKKNEQET